MDLASGEGAGTLPRSLSPPHLEGAASVGFAQDSARVHEPLDGLSLLFHRFSRAPSTGGGAGREQEEQVALKKRRHKLVGVMVGVAAMSLLGAGIGAAATGALHAGPQSDGSGITPVGYRVTPAGQQT